ncbi:MAG: DNA polymerase III subunit beta [Candidatus Moranbacteria bacterium CG23_combo_of_CG06-09_8_20_14_all_35_22]|nr:MAG: DNA polymerase III subunit beta [Candidatus Moranbacteria bacterium CG23_combo_of_CG06-09_8_20_14_all_35_22]
MKLICTQENLKKAIFNCERVVAKKNTLPILNNILFETEKGGLKLSATNLELGVSSKIGAKIEKEGKITIPARIISNFSNNLLGGENISLELVENNLKIKSGGNKAVIKGISAEDFPLLPLKKTDHLLDISSLDLKIAILKVMPAVAFNEARQELTGINLILKEKELIFAATDSFRLAEFRLKIEEININKEKYQLFIEKNENVIIPFNVLAELNRVLAPEIETRVKITIEERQIFFETEGIKLVSRLINGKYPEYKHIMPADYKTRIVGEKQVLQNAIKMANVFSSGGSNEITLKISAEEKKIFILSSSAEAGENSTELNFDITGPSQEVVFNAKYLLDGINVIASNQVAILLNSEATPVAVREIDEKSGEVLENFTYIVMPIKN